MLRIQEREETSVEPMKIDLASQAADVSNKDGMRNNVALPKHISQASNNHSAVMDGNYLLGYSPLARNFLVFGGDIPAWSSFERCGEGRMQERRDPRKPYGQALTSYSIILGRKEHTEMISALGGGELLGE
ncbi:hypothetical protein DUI87_30488 [Hirundo rustica rustica]|uniref:Uncharacterized protein n=1 Tax=Hirundo rustica rustica TaxID=333673 RepID=A0A3M0IWQ8_HIRRU|nr:hypothetical protein DUI87_30488 [Hirundo rustica rustica]